MYYVKQEVIDWLLMDDSPPIQYLTLLNLLEKNANNKDVLNAKKTIMLYPPIIEILENQKEQTYWYEKGKDKNYKKYLGTFWQLLFLSELQAQTDERITNAIEYIFETGQAPNGGFSISGTDSLSIECLTSNILRTLIHFGYLDDERTQNALEFLLKRFVDRNGKIRCQLTSLINNCYMVLPKILFALSSIPEEKRTIRVKKGIELCTQRLLENYIFKYIPSNNNEWLKIVAERKLKGIELVEEKKKFLEKNPTKYKVPKAGWLKFGFPLGYTSDILDAMKSLVNAGIPYSENMESALQIIAEKNVNGRWLIEKSYKSQMYTEIDSLNTKSKWLTLYALIVLKFYNKLSFE
ncbi:MAG TPA: hypothetical protein VMX55_08295 [candidate division Zixibacteria bacterium]|nr:hypothetical protein [candidate division Zixibacteria bacterium]